MICSFAGTGEECGLSGQHASAQQLNTSFLIRALGRARHFDEARGLLSIVVANTLLLNPFPEHWRIERRPFSAKVECMKKLDAFKLSLLAASVAGLGVGCASSGYARMDDNRMDAGAGASVGGVGASASADVGSDRGYATTETRTMTTDTRMDRDYSMRHDRYNSHYDLDRSEGAARVTVSALSFTPETRANWVNKFPFYDQNWRLSTIDTYTFAVPDPDLRTSASTDLPQFSVNLPPGSVFVESAGGAGEVRTGRIIQHSPNPSR
jgi:hypothetical protein